MTQQRELLNSRKRSRMRNLDSIVGILRGEALLGFDRHHKEAHPPDGYRYLEHDDLQRN